MTVYLIHQPEHKNTNNGDKSIFFLYIWKSRSSLRFRFPASQEAMILDWEMLYMSVGECSVFGYDLNIESLLTKTMSKIAFLKASTLQICNDKYARRLQSRIGGLRYVTMRDLL